MAVAAGAAEVKDVKSGGGGGGGSDGGGGGGRGEVKVEREGKTSDGKESKGEAKSESTEIKGSPAAAPAPAPGGVTPAGVPDSAGVPAMAASKRYTMVVAIDLGTSGSGVAYAARHAPKDIIAQQDWGGGSAPHTKTPTDVMLDSDFDLVSFGRNTFKEYHNFDTEERMQVSPESFSPPLHASVIDCVACSTTSWKSSRCAYTRMICAIDHLCR